MHNTLFSDLTLPEPASSIPEDPTSTVPPDDPALMSSPVSPPSPPPVNPATDPDAEFETDEGLGNLTPLCQENRAALAQAGLKPGAVTVYADDGQFFATGDFAHCPEDEIRHNIAVLVKQLARQHRTGSAALHKDYDATTSRTSPVDWPAVWRERRIYHDVLYTVSPDGALGPPIALALVPGLGIRPCAPDDSGQLARPPALTCPVCGTIIEPVFNIGTVDWNTSIPLWDWRCPNYGTHAGHLWRKEYLDTAMTPPKKKGTGKKQNRKNQEEAGSEPTLQNDDRDLEPGQSGRNGTVHPGA